MPKAIQYPTIKVIAPPGIQGQCAVCDCVTMLRMTDTELLALGPGVCGHCIFALFAAEFTLRMSGLLRPEGVLPQ